jgi:hypothetical protein
MKLTRSSIALLFYLFSNIAFAADLWRVPEPVIENGKYYSFIVDRGKLQKAVRSSTFPKAYLFSETKVGAQPLALIGTPVEIIDFLLKNETYGIKNTITKLPEIYMGIAPYVPQERFSGIFPVNDFSAQLLKQFNGLAPGTTITDAAGVAGSLKELKEAIGKLSEEEKKKGSVLYIKFSYLPEEGMQKTGEKEITFGDILKIIQKQKI